jgi:polyhydroxyalkanoate synthesis regulator phasin
MTSTTEATPLLKKEQTERFSERWDEIQASFVDRPQQAVEEADALVSDLMQRLTGTFANERDRLEKQWAKGDDVSTEDLRVALTRYRSFFDRLLST